MANPPSSPSAVPGLLPPPAGQIQAPPPPSLDPTRFIIPRVWGIEYQRSYHYSLFINTEKLPTLCSRLPLKQLFDEKNLFLRSVEDDYAGRTAPSDTHPDLEVSTLSYGGIVKTRPVEMVDSSQVLDDYRMADISLRNIRDQLNEREPLAVEAFDHYRLELEKSWTKVLEIINGDNGGWGLNRELQFIEHELSKMDVKFERNLFQYFATIEQLQRGLCETH